MYGRRVKDRLSAIAWVDAGLAALTSQGFTALKADRLAKSLGVSRGSFYWHFHDVEDYRSAVLERWRQVASEGVIENLDRFADPTAALRDLIGRAFRGTPRLEAAMRSWASHDAAVREAVLASDRRRTDYIRGTLIRAGVAPEAAGSRAQILYWAFVGFVVSESPPPRAEQARLVEELLRIAVASC